ncbi:MAG: FixG Ig-like domain-containing protein, partial [Macromonas sp.]
RALRPRVLIYSGILVAICVAVGASLLMRTPLKVDVIRDRASLARMVEQGRIENVYLLRLMNATETAQTYQFTIEGLPGIGIASTTEVTVLPTEVRSVPIRVQIPPNSSAPGSHTVHFTIRATGDAALQVTEKSVFLVPR